MGAAASTVGAGGSMFEALKAQEEVKQKYTQRVAEVIAKGFPDLKAKGDVSQEELERHITTLLRANESFIIDQQAAVFQPQLGGFQPPQGATGAAGGGLTSGLQVKRGLQKQRSDKKIARRRSFDNLSYEDIMLSPPSAEISRAPIEKKPAPIPEPVVVNRKNSNTSEISGRIRIKSFVSESGEVYSNSTDPEALFQKLCVASVKQITSKKNLTHMASVDGSEGGHLAFQTMMLMKKKLDHVCIFHAYSKENEENLPVEFQSDAVRSRYEAELITKLHMPTTKFTFFWEEKKDRNIRKVLVELLNDYKGVKNPMRPTRNEPNFFYCGYTGTKGKKLENSTLGSVTDIALRSVHMPVIICKSLCAASKRLFVIAVDGSEFSQHGFDIAMALISPRDTLHCVTVSKSSSDDIALSQEKEKSCENKDNADSKNCEGGNNVGEMKDIGESKNSGDDEADELDKKALESIRKKQIVTSSNEERMMPLSEMREYYSGEMNHYGPADSDFISLSCGENQSVAECLVQYSDSIGADFFAISPRARPKFTSVTEYIIATVKANIILCKN